VAASRDDLVLAHLNHPLVAMATRLLRAEVWGAGNVARVASLKMEHASLKDPVLAAYSRLVLVGADGARLHEELFPAGGWLRGTSFLRMGVNELAEVLDIALGPDAALKESSEPTRAELARTWPQVSSSLRAAIDSRASEREASLEKSLARRQMDEEARTLRLLESFEQSLRDVLGRKGTDLQLTFADLDSDERGQLEQDRAAWQVRLDALPGERVAEIAAIARRYESVQVLSFPAAVVHLVPAGGSC